MKDEKNKNNFKDFLPYLCIIVLVLFIKSFIMSPSKVNGVSMVPTLHDSDIMLLDEVSYRFTDIKRFDIVVVKREGEYLIKRVIGLPGEEVEYRDNKLYINGKKIKEKYTREETFDFTASVGDNQYYVLGDNRLNSTDSRIFGAVMRDEIVGKTNLTVFPFSRFGTKK